MSTSPSGTCVFCGRAIGPDEPATGRPPASAHAACADAALADDRHWDAIARASGQEPAIEKAEAPERQPAGASPRRQGCLSLLLAAALAIGLAVRC